MDYELEEVNKSHWWQ